MVKLRNEAVVIFTTAHYVGYGWVKLINQLLELVSINYFYFFWRHIISLGRGLVGFCFWLWVE